MDRPPATDPDLDRARAGDTAAFGRLVLRLQRPLFAYLGRLALPAAVVEEIAQEAFVRAWRHLDQFDPRRAAFATWLFTIARRLALDELGRAALAREASWGDAPPDVASDEDGPEARMHARRRHARLHAAIGRLTPADRSLLALSCLAELDAPDVARIERLTPGALRTRLHRIRERLRALLEHDDG